MERFLTILTILIMLAWAGDGFAKPGLPEGMNDADWRAISEQIGDHRHRVAACKDGYQAKNASQEWGAKFTPEGFLVTPQSGGWTWGLALLGYGLAGAEKPVSGVPKISAKGRRVEYAWDGNLTEWMINDNRGLEHGFTLKRRPAGPGGPLRVMLRTRGGLKPVENPGGLGVTFVNGQGAAVLNYDGLKVFDAAGRTLPARLEVAEGGLAILTDDSDAVYPLTIDPYAQQAYLKASNTNGGDGFGWSVAISGDTAVVGAPEEDSNAVGVDGRQADNSAGEAGAAYVFVRTGGVWTQQAYLKASNAEAGDGFGWSVAISGNTVIVGAPYEDSSDIGNPDDNSATSAGAAYVFMPTTPNSWTQKAYLKASNTGMYDQFGWSVAISGYTAIVGALYEDSIAVGNQADNSADDAGAAYVFRPQTRTGDFWTQQAYLKASNTEMYDYFGWSVAISGDTAIVGARGENSGATGVGGAQNDNSEPASGAAYVFVYTGVVWDQQAYLKASNTETWDCFGESVAISGDTAIVGAWGEDSGATGVNGDQTDNSAAESGAAYVFVRTGNAWAQEAYLKASNTRETDEYFGNSVAISGDTAIVGAWDEDSNAVGVDGNQVDNSATRSGAAYVFVRTGIDWAQQAYLKASNTEAYDGFGASVAIFGDTAIVGAPGEASNAVGVGGNQADNSAVDSGAAYVYDISNLDFGDLPPGYGLTLLGNNGARHEIGGIWLGAAVDVEFDGAESVDASGDGADEDGIAVNGDWMEAVNGGAVDVTVTGGSGYLSSWVDWNGDNDFLDTGEQILNMVSVVAATQTISFDIPAGALPNLGANTRFARFRLDDTNAVVMTPTGLVTNGEVEDYQLAFAAITSEFQFSQANYAVNEDGMVDVTVMRGNTTGVASVDIQLADNTAFGGSAPLVYPEDYDNTAISVNFPDTAGTQTVTIPINDDNLDEPDEIVNLALANPYRGVIGMQNTATLTILDNDAAPLISIDDPTVDEGAGTVMFAVSLSAASGRDVRVTYQTNNGTATSVDDYTGIGPTELIIPAGNTGGTISVIITDDASGEPDETFSVDLSAPSNAAFSDNQGIGTIRDNDISPSFQFTASNQTGAEDAGTMTVTAQLSAVSGVDVTVPFALGGTATEGAGADYTITASPIVIRAGELSQTVTVTINDDALTEPAETVTLTMGAPANATPGEITEHIITIADNDSPLFVALPITDVTVDEDAANTVINLVPVFGDNENPPENLEHEVRSVTNPALFTTADIAGGTLTLDYAPNAFGTSDITVRATDTDGLFVDDTFTVTVNPVNDAPEFTLLYDIVAYTAGSGPYAADAWARFYPGADNETGQTAAYSIHNLSAPGFFSEPPAVDANGGLTFNQDPGFLFDSSLDITFELEVRDDGGTENGGIDTSGRRVVTIRVSPSAPTPTCFDGIQNGNETDIDCGGPDCPECVPPQPTCDDGIQNGEEEDVDCGGACEPCEVPPEDDLCPDDPDKTAPGVCGCGVPESECLPPMIEENNYMPVEPIYEDTPLCKNCAEDITPDPAADCGGGLLSVVNENPAAGDVFFIDPDADGDGDPNTGIYADENGVVFYNGNAVGNIVASGEDGIRIVFDTGQACEVAGVLAEAVRFVNTSEGPDMTPRQIQITLGPGESVAALVLNFTENRLCNCDPDADAKPEWPAITSPANEAVVAPDQTVRLAAKPYAGGSVARTVWLVGRKGRRNWEIVHDTRTDLLAYTVEGLLPGVKYILRVGHQIGETGEIEWSSEHTFKVGASDTTETVRVPPGDGSEDYTLISFTRWPDDPSFANDLAGIIGPALDGYNYRFAAFDQTRGCFLEYGCGNFTVEPGRAYWVLARNGLDATVTGIPVSQTEDFEMPLAFNANENAGWNLIAPPNMSDCHWGEVRVVVYDTDGRNTKRAKEPVFGPTSLADVSFPNDFIDHRLFRIEKGKYYADTSKMEPNKGYLTLVKRKGVSLIFPGQKAEEEPEPPGHNIPPDADTDGDGVPDGGNTRVDFPLEAVPGEPCPETSSDDNACFLGTVLEAWEP